MNTPTHTPGPWVIYHSSRSVFSDKNSELIATMQDLPQREGENILARAQEYIANARLIAAAPDLLEALISCEAHMNSPFVRKAYEKNGNGTTYHKIQAANRAAISKATEG